jgi:hypothetical protein
VKPRLPRPQDTCLTCQAGIYEWEEETLICNFCGVIEDTPQAAPSREAPPWEYTSRHRFSRPYLPPGASYWETQTGLDAKQAAEILHISPAWVHTLTHQGRLRAITVPNRLGIKVRRWLLEDLHTYAHQK